MGLTYPERGRGCVGRASTILGLIGGVWGLQATLLPLLAFGGLRYGYPVALAQIFSLAVLGSILAVAGGIISSYRDRVGGAVLLLGGALALSWWVLYSLILPPHPVIRGSFQTVFGFVLVSAWWIALILTGGLTGIFGRVLRPRVPNKVLQQPKGPLV